MEEHHIHDTKVGFHSNTDIAKSYLKRDMSREGVQKMFSKARDGEDQHFMADGTKFKMHADQDGNIHIERHS